MKTIDAYKEKQQSVILILQHLLDYLIEGNKYGIQVDPSIIKKIETAINNAEESKLKIALIGGFSEGKTSIAAAWSEHYDKSSMKISQAESTDQIKIYNFDDDYVLIDTPGLYGFKENQDKEKYKDITKKYISESDIIIYVMSSDNPIKQSHKEDLVWLFKDLNLLSRTVFVLSRFDEEADIDDEDDYQETLEIKRNNIINRLIDFGIISVGYEPSIVAVSANPYGEGIEKWLDNISEYKRLSHISELQEATLNKIKSSGKNEIMLSTQQSIVKDVLSQSLPLAEQKVSEAVIEIDKLNKLYIDAKKDLNKFSKSITTAQNKLRTFITDYFADLILQAEGTTLETINEFFEKNIGEKGVMIETKIQNEFTNQIGIINGEISIFRTKIYTNTQHYNNVVGEMAIDSLKVGGEYLKNGGVVINNTQVLAIRDMLELDVKFKPWGAVKLADKLSKGLAYFGAFIGIGIEAWDSYSKMKKQEEFAKAKKKIVKAFNDQRREYLDLINGPEFITKFFPEYDASLNEINALQEEVYRRESFRNDFEQWKKRGDIIDAEFTEILE